MWKASMTAKDELFTSSGTWFSNASKMGHVMFVLYYPGPKTAIRVWGFLVFLLLFMAWHGFCGLGASPPAHKNERGLGPGALARAVITHL